MATFPSPVFADRSEVMNPNFTKHYLPDGRVMHHFRGAHDVDFHDHPFAFVSTIGPAGGYTEEILVEQPGGWAIETHHRAPGQTFTVEAGTKHRLVGLDRGECWTVIQASEKVQEPAFYCLDQQGRLQQRFWFEPADAWQPYPRQAA